ncbi:MAG: AhpC/TSA family protein, partial [Kofleriaceae bacterium]|nr:AhpC/TSA family protein [Kofleriaceae bacterium]
MRCLVSLDGEPIEVPDPARLVHLQFRRFAGCPVCNLHLR